ncbi:GTPase domain-containing protein [Macrococcus equipercicus]|uniref:GTPase domain-containing protein n=1 Tax=Macrococcus equipercicus TaxID=69967 RepID=A0ABQ6R914_9STAP|nr:GTPase domain-containing protein [Macrococcus equipercicus]KAA1039650.1 GTPase domain-containing protein [Macrococcus equipercicus]
MEIHPLVTSYQQFITNRSNHKIGIIGQPDAGKSSLINALNNNNTAHTSVHTDATLQTKEYAFDTYGILVDFPGVGTEEVSTGYYKKLIQQSGINHFVYVFESKIKEADIELIKYLAKNDKELILIYNKTDALVDITNHDTVEELKRDKNTELKVTLKPYIKKPVSYIFVSTLTQEGLDTLRQTITEIFQAQQQDYKEKYAADDMLESYLNYKAHSLLPKLFTPSFKEVVMKKNYQSLERTILNHFKIQEDDVLDYKKEWPTIQEHIAKFDHPEVKEKVSGLKELAKIAQLLRTVFKLKTLNPVSTGLGALFEAGVVNAFPTIQGLTNYISEIKDIARKILEASQEAE